MKITKSRLKQIIKEEISEGEEALIAAIGELSRKIGDLDVSLDYLAGSVGKENPLWVGYKQSAFGRAARAGQMDEIEKIIREELEDVLSEEDT
jgi:hypothetical protein